MRTKSRSIATFHRPIHSHWSLPLTFPILPYLLLTFCNLQFLAFNFYHPPIPHLTFCTLQFLAFNFIILPFLKLIFRNLQLLAFNFNHPPILAFDILKPSVLGVFNFSHPLILAFDFSHSCVF